MKLFISSNDGHPSHRTHTPVKFSRFRGFYVANWLMDIIEWPGMVIHNLKVKYYYSRLDYQYERGRADGLREGLYNADAYKDLTDEELKAVLSGPGAQE